MENLSRKNLFLSAPVGAVEVATLTNLFGYYRYHELPIAAFLLALSFSVLLVATAILVSQDVGSTTRVLLIVGGFMLFTVQGLSNVSESYLHAQGVLPAAALSALWGGTAQEWMVRSSWIWGGVINLVGALYWLALGGYYRRERRSERFGAEVLEDLLKNRR